MFKQSNAVAAHLRVHTAGEVFITTAPLKVEKRESTSTTRTLGSQRTVISSVSQLQLLLSVRHYGVQPAGVQRQERISTTAPPSSA